MYQKELKMNFFKRFLTSLGWELHWTQELCRGIFNAFCGPGTMHGVQWGYLND